MLFDVLNISSVALCCAIFGSAVFVIKTLLPVDFGSEVTGDFNVMAESDSSFHLFSIESIAAFFMCSGWISWMCLEHLKYGLKLSALIGLAFGVAGMFLFAWLISQFKKLEQVSNPQLEELIGKTGKAYMNFAPKGSAKIQIEFNAKLDTLDAINDSDEEIKAFDNIKVVKVKNNQIYIVKGD
ncbi:MAG: hypothetical protein IJB79_08530 [Candidatus Gastranaerophilales bacterium]|nr:hypothetical protein [Candidatus Gastranaerophilales bacterium]